MTAPFPHKHTHDSPNNRIDRHSPPRQPHNPHRQALPKHPAGDRRAERPRPAAHALAQAMNGAQHGRMRAAVVDEDGGGGQGEGAGEDLQGEDGGDAGPDPRAVGGRRRPRRRWQQRHVRRREVRHREERQRQPERPHRAQPRRQRRVKRQLQRYADRPEDGERYADARRRHRQAAGEVEWGLLRVAWG